MASEVLPVLLKRQISKELRAKANDFLNSKRNANNLIDIIEHLEQSMSSKQPLISALLTLEVVFSELLKRRDMLWDDEARNVQSEANAKYRSWLCARYEDTIALMLDIMECGTNKEAVQALVSSMKLLINEGKYPLNHNEPLAFPCQRLRSILRKLVTPRRSQTFLIERFKEYTEYLDVVHYCWSLLQHDVVSKSAFYDETVALNFLELMNALRVTKELQEQQKLICPLSTENSTETKDRTIDYALTRKYINKVWSNLMVWTSGHMTESVHKRLLIVLLERVLPHLEKPILLTDFIMDSLDCGGAISLLALQGVFTLIQKHNITYPNVYEKLYSMFEPKMFFSKFKARLFYLADIFLSSTHLPESLVAAFVKRLARLSLAAPPQDIIIILYFIGNLLLRHAGLKRLICAETPVNVVRDPYIMEEREPAKSLALESSLWEVVALQKHAVPSVATAARFISQPLPTQEWDMSSMLEVEEYDIFDQEIRKKQKQYALAFERPRMLFLSTNDKVSQYWELLRNS